MSELKRPLQLVTAQAEAQIHEHGAHLIRWQPSGQEPVLFLAREAIFDSSTSIRGGIPVCFPWFGAGRTGQMTPAHGFARTAPWEVIEQEGDRALLRLDASSLDAAQRAPFPHPVRAELEVRAGQRLQVSLTVTNTGDTAMSYEAALHTYLLVGDVAQARVEGLDGARYLDKLDPQAGEKTQEGVLVFDGETDRVYRSGGPVTVVDPVMARRLEISAPGAQNLVVWTPWERKAQQMRDMGDDEWPRMLCIEAANVLDRAVELAPGQRHTLGYEIKVGALPGQ